MMMMTISLILCIEGSWSKVIGCQRKSTGQTLSRREMTSWDKILKIGAKSFLKSTKVIHHFQFIEQVIILELQNNLTSKWNAHKLIFTSQPFFGFLSKHCQDLNFFRNQNRSNPWKADENIGNRVCSYHKVYNVDPGEGQWSNEKQKQVWQSSHFDSFLYFQITLKSTEPISIVSDVLFKK